MSGLVDFVVVLFIVVDPIGGATMHVRRRMALRGTSTAAALSSVFFLSGDALLSALGITLPACRIAGGLLLLLLVINMVFARQSGLCSATLREQEEAQQRQGITMFLLAFRLFAGAVRGKRNCVGKPTRNTRAANRGWRGGYGLISGSS